MNPDTLIQKIRGALGNPSSGQIADALPIIEGAILDAYRGDTTPTTTPTPTSKPTKETRITTSTETR